MYRLQLTNQPDNVNMRSLILLTTCASAQHSRIVAEPDEQTSILQEGVVPPVATGSLEALMAAGILDTNGARPEQSTIILLRFVTIATTSPPLPPVYMGAYVCMVWCGV